MLKCAGHCAADLVLRPERMETVLPDGSDRRSAEALLLGLVPGAGAFSQMGWLMLATAEASLANLEPTHREGTVGKCRLPDSFLPVVDCAMPLLAAGLADWRPCGYSGLFLYSLTPEGRALATERRATGKARPSAWPKLRRRFKKIKTRSPAATDSYCDASEAAKQARESATLTNSIRQHLDPSDPPEAATA